MDDKKRIVWPDRLTALRHWLSHDGFGIFVLLIFLLIGVLVAWAGVSMHLRSKQPPTRYFATVSSSQTAVQQEALIGYCEGTDWCEHIDDDTMVILDSPMRLGSRWLRNVCNPILTGLVCVELSDD